MCVCLLLIFLVSDRTGLNEERAFHGARVKRMRRPRSGRMVTPGFILRTVALVIGLAEVAVLLFYFIPLLYGVPYGQWLADPSSVNASAWDDNFVSDLLFHDLVYRSLVTALTGLNLLMCAVFVFRLNSRIANDMGECFGPYFLLAELICMVASWLGWSVLTASYQESDNGVITTAHLAGPAVFVSGNTSYFLLMLINIWVYSRRRWDMQVCLVFALVVVFFCASVGSGGYFTYGVLAGLHVFGWIWEHLAFICFIAAHVCLFICCYLLACDEARNCEDVAGPRLFFGERLKVPVRITRICYVAIQS